MLLCVSFSMKNGMTGYATRVLLKNKLNSPYVSYISFTRQPNPPPPPPPHTHTPNFRKRINKQILRTSGARNIESQTHSGRGGGGGGIYLRCTSEIYLLMIWELVRYWLYYNFAFSRMRLSGKQFTSKPWISKQLPTPYAL